MPIWSWFPLPPDRHSIKTIAMEKLYYSIGEVAEILGENTSAVRFWANSFPRYIHPVRNAKGNRQFKAEDIEVFKRIHFLVKTQGMTLEGAAKALASKEGSGVDSKLKVLESLKEMRQQLVEIKESL